MKRIHVAAALAAGAVLMVVAARPARAQDWRPPTTQMPQMPASSEVNEGWAAGQGRWLLAGGARAIAEGGGSRARFVRFTGESMRVLGAWTDRNGDGKADMVEVYRDGALVAQLLDPGYDGTADVIRVYADGKLVREERL
jgi:hypothetical protein